MTDPSTTSVVNQWLGLLLDRASSDDLRNHADRLIAAGSDAPTVHAEALQALRLGILLQQHERRGDIINVLNGIASKIAGLSDIEELFRVIVDQVRVLLGSDLAYLGLFEDDGMRIAIASGTTGSALSGAFVPDRLGLVAQIRRTSEPAWSYDYPNDRGFRHFDEGDLPLAAEGVGGILGAPLPGFEGIPIGVLFSAVRRPHRYSSEEIQILTALAAHAAVAIDNARARAKSQHITEELRSRTNELETMLAWDASLRRVLSKGGGVDPLLAEVSRIAGREVRFRAGSLRPGPYDCIVRADGRTLGQLTVEGTVDPVLLDRAATAVAMVLRAEAGALEATRHHRDGLVLSLFTGHAESVGESRQLATMAGLDLYQSYVVIVIEPAATDTEKARGLIEALRWPASTVTVRRGSKIVVLMCAAVPTDAIELWCSASPFDATVGVSKAYAVDDIRSGHHEAQQTLSTLNALGREGEIARAEDLGIYRVLLGAGTDIEVPRVINDALGPLMDVEQHRNLHLLDTVEAYLTHLQRHSASAKALGIHPNTLYQRLAVIDRVLGADWRTPSRSLELQILLKLRASMRSLTSVDDVSRATPAPRE